MPSSDQISVIGGADGDKVAGSRRRVKAARQRAGHGAAQRPVNKRHGSAPLSSGQRVNEAGDDPYPAGVAANATRRDGPTDRVQLLSLSTARKARLLEGHG